MSEINISLAFEGHSVRMLGSDERPEWVARDVCDVLGNGEPANVLRHFPREAKGVSTVHTPGGPQEMATVTESGLYRLIFRSRKPEAQRFQDFVFGEVLPSIRKYGCYPHAIQPVLAPVAMEQVVQMIAQAFVPVLAQLREDMAATRRDVECVNQLRDDLVATRKDVEEIKRGSGATVSRHEYNEIRTMVIVLGRYWAKLGRVKPKASHLAAYRALGSSVQWGGVGQPWRLLPGPLVGAVKGWLGQQIRAAKMNADAHELERERARQCSIRFATN